MKRSVRRSREGKKPSCAYAWERAVTAANIKGKKEREGRGGREGEGRKEREGRRGKEREGEGRKGREGEGRRGKGRDRKR